MRSVAGLDEAVDGGGMKAVVVTEWGGRSGCASAMRRIHGRDHARCGSRFRPQR